MLMIEASPCDHPRLLGASLYLSEQEREWYERHEPWLWRQLEHSTTLWIEEPAYAVNAALGWIFDHADGRLPRWEQLDVRDLLLEDIPRGGLPHGFVVPDVLRGLREFVAWMADNGELARQTADRLLRQINGCERAFLERLGAGPAAGRSQRSAA
jgi:hypothetical protein